jgi:hypothetical protein
LNSGFVCKTSRRDEYRLRVARRRIAMEIPKPGEETIEVQVETLLRVLNATERVFCNAAS